VAPDADPPPGVQEALWRDWLAIWRVPTATQRRQAVYDFLDTHRSTQGQANKDFVVTAKRLQDRYAQRTPYVGYLIDIFGGPNEGEEQAGFWPYIALQVGFPIRGALGHRNSSAGFYVAQGFGVENTSIPDERRSPSDYYGSQSTRHHAFAFGASQMVMNTARNGTRVGVYFGEGLVITSDLDTVMSAGIDLQALFTIHDLNDFIFGVGVRYQPNFRNRDNHQPLPHLCVRFGHAYYLP